MFRGPKCCIKVQWKNCYISDLHRFSGLFPAPAALWKPAKSSQEAKKSNHLHLPPFALDLQNRSYFTCHPSCSVYHIFIIICLTKYFVHICTNKSHNLVLNYFKSKHSSMFLAGIFDHSNGKAPKKLSKINQSVHVPITYFLLVGIEFFLLYILLRLFCPKP